MISSPHGGRLINRVVKGSRREALAEEAKELIKVEVDAGKASDIYNIAVGTYSPLEGFLTRENLQNVLDDYRLINDIPWTIPVVLDVGRDEISNLKEGDDLAITYGNKIIALLRVEEIYGWDKREYARKMFKTEDANHPGVAKALKMKDFLIGGKIDLIEIPEQPFQKYALTPVETRILFREKGWRTIVAFQTRNVPHRGHEYVQKAALTFTDGLLIHPLVGWKKRGDYKDEVIVAAYEALIRNYYPKDSVVLSVLWMQMRYAGPREAIHHAIVRKNFGCTHFIVGRDHAGVGNYYSPYEAWEMFDQFPDLGITPLFIRESFYCRKCGGMVNAKICPHREEDRVRISGTKLREIIKNRVRPPEIMMRPEVVDVVLSYGNPFIE